MATVRYISTMLALISVCDLLLDVEATPLKRISDDIYEPVGGNPGTPILPLTPIGGNPDLSGLHEALLREPIDFGNFGNVGSFPVANIGSSTSTSSVVAKRDKGDDVASLIIVLTAAGIASLTKSLYYWFGGKKSFNFLDTECQVKTFPYINSLQLRYKSEFECDDYPDTGYGRSANRRKAADEAMEDFLRKTNENKLFKKAVVDQWLKSHAVPTPAPKPSPVTQKPKTWAEICG